jgi:CRP-like cAMP-binding protein
VEEIGAGGILGEMALIGQTTRTATVQALVDTEIAPINERLFTFMVHQTPFFALAMLRVLSDRLRRMNRLI